jgi:hypothetical protein
MANQPPNGNVKQAQPQALVAVDTSSVVNALVPSSLDGAMQFARWLSQSALLPKNYAREHDIFFIICAGMELGLPPMAALRGLYTVHGRTALESKTKAALCLQKHAAQYFKRTEFTPLACTWETLRNGQVEPVRMRYTLAEAQEAGLAPDPKHNRPGKEGPWRQYTQRMISHRALGWLCDDVYPDIVMGVATAEDFDPGEFTFKPIGAGVELGSAPSAPAPVAEVISGVPAGTKAANPPQEYPKDTSKQGDGTPAGAQPKVIADEPKKEVGSFAKDPNKPPLEDDDDVIDIITRMGQTGTLIELRQFAVENIHGRSMSDQVRSRLLKAYEAHYQMIEDAAVQEKKDKKGK